MMNAMKTTMLLANLTAIFMGFGYLIGGDAARYRQEQANDVPTGPWSNRNQEVPPRSGVQ